MTEREREIESSFYTETWLEPAVRLPVHAQSLAFINNVEREKVFREKTGGRQVLSVNLNVYED